MLCFYLNDYHDKSTFVNKRLFQTITDQFHQTSFEMIRNADSKLRTYGLFKKMVGFESYLTDIKNFKHRRSLTKFRLSNHDLAIETGRYKQRNTETKKELRVCPLCNDGIEDEIHFLFLCPLYKPIREERLILPSLLQRFTKSQKIEIMMSKPNNKIAKFIHNCFELRTLLMNNPKRTD